MKADPLAVTEQEYDYRFPWREVQDVLAPYLLRRQMQGAAASAGTAPADAPLLSEGLRRAEGKLLPILMDRGQALKRDLAADGAVRAAAPALEEALLALFREAVGYMEQNRPLGLATRQREGFLLTELAVWTRRGLKGEGLRPLWDGLYGELPQGDAPGGKLRRACDAIPGAFAAVRRTKHGFTLTLGLPSVREARGE
jgi:hypothetical protein